MLDLYVPIICSECYVVLDLYLLKRLKQIALDHDMTLNALLIEGVNLVIQKYEGKFKKHTLRLLRTMLEEITGIFIIVLNDQFEKLKIILRGGSLEQEHDLRCFICTKKIRDGERFNFEKNQHDYYHLECWKKLNNKQ